MNRHKKIALKAARNPKRTNMLNKEAKLAAQASRAAIACAVSVVIIATVGCGTGKPATQNRDFFTSGSREADQRASQRMAKDEQLAGSGEGAGEKRTKKAAVSKPGGDLSPTGNTDKAAVAEGKTTLFDRLGGEKGITAIIEDFTPRAIQDPRVNWQRKGLKRTGLHFGRANANEWAPTPENIARLKKHMVQFIVLATGGPARYDGKEMREAHAGMRISNAQFDAVLGDLKASLDKVQVPNKEQKELISIIESTRPQIVVER
jgi:hemoglobin